MGRNLFRRIEVAFPVLDRDLKARVIAEGLKPYLADNRDAWELDGDGAYARPKVTRRSRPRAAQQELIDRLSEQPDVDSR
jgi:polyphosphate kinase